MMSDILKNSYLITMTTIERHNCLLDEFDSFPGDKNNCSFDEIIHFLNEKIVIFLTL